MGSWATEQEPLSARHDVEASHFLIFGKGYIYRPSISKKLLKAMEVSMKTLVSQIPRKAALWMVLGVMALAGLGSVAQLWAQRQTPDDCGTTCGTPHGGICHHPCYCDIENHVCVIL